MDDDNAGDGDGFSLCVCVFMFVVNNIVWILFLGVTVVVVVGKNITNKNLFKLFVLRTSPVSWFVFNNSNFI